MTTISSQVRLAQQRASLGSTATASRLGAAQASAVAGAAAPVSAIVSLGSTVARAATAVDYTDRIKLTGKRSVDALLAGGNRWFHTPGGSGALPSAVARHEFTYSFIESAGGLNAMDTNGFQALTHPQRAVVQAALGTLSDVVDVRFTQVASGGDIQFGSNNQASSAGYARYPNEGSQVFLANNQASFAGSWEAGSYEWQTVLHETAHAMGLKHPGNYNAGGGGTPGPYLARSADHQANTIMSYHSPASLKRIAYDGSSFSVSTVNPSSLQAYDVAALQYLYGAPASTDAITYRWSDGQALSQTIWNTNAGSRIDLSNQSGENVLDLRAGKASSIGLRDAYADMGPFDRKSYARLTSGGRRITSILGTPGYTGRNNLVLAAGSTLTQASGGSGRDTVITNTLGNRIDTGAGSDAVFYSGGNATLAGGEGDDTVYLLRRTGTTWTLSQDGQTATWTRKATRTQAATTLATVSLAGFEHVKFWNGSTMRSTGVALVA